MIGHFTDARENLIRSLCKAEGSKPGTVIDSRSSVSFVKHDEGICVKVKARVVVYRSLKVIDKRSPSLRCFLLTNN